MTKSFRILAVLAALGLLSACVSRTKSASSRSSVDVFDAEGAAAYDEGDLTATSNAAVTDAQKNALESVAGLFMDARSKTEKYGVLKTNLLRAPGIYVKKYKVLSERREGAFYRVNIRVWLYVDKISSALRGLSMTEAAKPGASAALMLDEYFASAASPYGDARAAFTDYLSRKTALSFLDNPALKNSRDEDSFFEAARASGADLVLIGRAEAGPMAAAQGPQAGFYPAKAKAEIKIYQSGSRALLAEISSVSNALDPAEEGAFRKALVSAGELLGAEAAGRADKFIKPETPLTLRVRGLSGIEDARKLKTAVDRLHISGSTFESYSAGEAVMTVYPVRPDSQEFSSALLRAGVFNLELESVSQFEAVFSVIR